MLGALAVFALFLLVYGVVPHEWLTWADSKLGLREDKILLNTKPIKFSGRALRDIVAATLYIVFLGMNTVMWTMWQKRGTRQAEAGSGHRLSGTRRNLRLLPSSDQEGLKRHRHGPHRRQPADAGVRDRLRAARGRPDCLTQAVKPKQFLHIDQAECILCEGCVDICPWKCIHMVSTDAIDEAVNTEQPGEDPQRPRGLRRRRRRLHPLRAVRRPLPHRRHHPRQGRRPLAPTATPHAAPTATATPTACGSEEPVGGRHTWPRPTETGTGPRWRSALAEVGDKTRSSQAWNSIFRPGSIFRKGYTDSPRNRSYVIMNNVLYHLHPVKVKRHAVKV